MCRHVCRHGGSAHGAMTAGPVLGRTGRPGWACCTDRETQGGERKPSPNRLGGRLRGRTRSPGQRTVRLLWLRLYARSLSAAEHLEGGQGGGSRSPGHRVRSHPFGGGGPGGLAARRRDGHGMREFGRGSGPQTVTATEPARLGVMPPALAQGDRFSRAAARRLRLGEACREGGRPVGGYGGGTGRIGLPGNAQPEDLKGDQENGGHEWQETEHHCPCHTPPPPGRTVVPCGISVPYGTGPMVNSK
jgi:hypothetical protein